MVLSGEVSAWVPLVRSGRKRFWLSPALRCTGRAVVMADVVRLSLVGASARDEDNLRRFPVQRRGRRTWLRNRRGECLFLFSTMARPRLATQPSRGEAKGTRYQIQVFPHGLLVGGRVPNGLVITGVDRLDHVGRVRMTQRVSASCSGERQELAPTTTSTAARSWNWDSVLLRCTPLAKRSLAAALGRSRADRPGGTSRSRRDASRRHKRGPLRIRHDALPTTVCRPMMLDPSLIGPFGAVADRDQRISAP